MRLRERKIHSENRGKEWKNNNHRVLFLTLICQFWDAAYVGVMSLVKRALGLKPTATESRAMS